MRLSKTTKEPDIKDKVSIEKKFNINQTGNVEV